MCIRDSLIGAAMVLLQISYPGYDDINILFTGDYNSKNIFLDIVDPPEWIWNLPLTCLLYTSQSMASGILLAKHIIE